MKPRDNKLAAEILSQNITLSIEFIKIIESEKQINVYKFLTVREKKK